MFRSVSWKPPAAIAALCCCSALGAAQPARVYTAGDYAQAEQFMAYNVNPLVYHTVKDPQWLNDGRFWYRDRGPDGETYMLVDPARHTKAPAFDQTKVAAALNAAIRSGRLTVSASLPVEARHLPIDDLSLEEGGAVLLTIGQRRVRCDLRGAGECRVAGDLLPDVYDVSPNGRKAAFIRDNNLWVRDGASGRETQLTRDGVPDFGYAPDNRGRASTHRRAARGLSPPRPDPAPPPRSPEEDAPHRPRGFARRGPGGGADPRGSPALS